MVKTFSVALDNHLDQEVTSLATCWIIDRVDGQTFRFTTNTSDVTADFGIGEGVQTYNASAGYRRSNIANTSELDVNNMDVTGIFDDAAITEVDLRAGLFDFAKCRIFFFNHQDTSMGVAKMLRGILGETTTTPNGFFSVELLSLEQVYTRTIAEFYSKDCRADLGDARCRLPIFPDVILRNTLFKVGDFVRVQTIGGDPLISENYENRIYQCTTEGTTAASQPAYDTGVGNTTTDGTAVFTAEEAWSRHGIVSEILNIRRRFKATEFTPNTGGPRGGFPEDWFNLGGLTWETGNNTGLTMEVRNFVADDGITIEQIFRLFLDMGFDIQVGDKFRVYPGCDKRFSTCQVKFDNKNNFIGEPYVPGPDYQAQYPDAR